VKRSIQILAVVAASVAFPILGANAMGFSFRDLAGQYLLAKNHPLAGAKMQELRPSTPPPACYPPSSGACVTDITNRVSYPSNQQLLDIARACQGNFGADCVDDLLNHISYPVYQDLLQVAQACKYNFGSACESDLLNHISYPSTQQLYEVAQACQGSDDACVQSLLAHISYPSYADLIQTAKACGGN
jgi:hypothetical protein